MSHTAPLAFNPHLASARLVPAEPKTFCSVEGKAETSAAIVVQLRTEADEWIVRLRRVNIAEMHTERIVDDLHALEASLNMMRGQLTKILLGEAPFSQQVTSIGVRHAAKQCARTFDLLAGQRLDSDIAIVTDIAALQTILKQAAKLANAQQQKASMAQLLAIESLLNQLADAHASMQQRHARILDRRQQIRQKIHSISQTLGRIQSDHYSSENLAAISKRIGNAAKQIS
jgi:hypothetical protein